MLPEHDGQWNIRALAQMHKLDSVFHESQRSNSVLTIGPFRSVSAKKGVTTPSGVSIPKGIKSGSLPSKIISTPISLAMIPRKFAPSESSTKV